MHRALCRLATVVGRAFGDGRGAFATVASTRFSSRASLSIAQKKPTVHTYLDNENFNAHCAMTNDPAYYETVVDTSVPLNNVVVTDQRFHELIAQDFGSKTAEGICNDFQTVSAYAAGKDFDFLDAKFDGFRNALITAVPSITDDQLMAVLRSVSLWNVQNAKDPVHYKLWSALDQECIKRYKIWSLNKLLLFMDHWYLMRLSKMSNFIWLGVRKLSRKPSRLTSRQLVQTMFFANTSRKFLPTLPMFDIEQEIILSYNDLNIKELGIVALGFFKTQTPIRNQDLVRNMYNSVIKEIKNIQSMELASFLKILRYCTRQRNAELMYKLMDVLIEKVDEVQLMCCTHMALLGSNLLIKHEYLLKKISERFVNEISQTRIKDLERITLALTMYNYNPETKPCIFETVVKELRSDSRNEEFEKHTKSYIFTLTYLAVNNIYPYDCISKALNVEILHKCFGKKLSKFTVPRDVLFLNNGLKLECPDYSGPLLENTLSKSCNEHLAWYSPISDPPRNVKIGDIAFFKVHKEMLKLFKNESFMHVCYLLPHHPKSDILFCIDTNNKLVTIPETIRNIRVFSDVFKPPDLGKWFVTMMIGRNSVILPSNEYTGLTLCKIRQLKTLGFEPICLSNNEVASSDVQKLLCTKLKTYNIELK